MGENFSKLKRKALWHRCLKSVLAGLACGLLSAGVLSLLIKLELLAFQPSLAFAVGGAICTLGQALLNLYQNLGASKEDAALYVTISLVLLSALFTGLNLYQKLTKYAGAGSVVPITGFANSVAASAIEYSKEGQVFGIGCKIFTIAGPVILYGILTSWALGLIYWILKLLGIV